MRLYRLVVDRLWDGTPLSMEDTAEVRLEFSGSTALVAIDAPFHGDPPPEGPPGPTDGLWRHEAVELFLARAEPTENRINYLELELGPHGHSLLLSFGRRRQRISQLEVLRFEAQVLGRRWRGHASFELRGLDRHQLRANAFALWGRDPRRYALAAELPGSRPDFHQPQSFPRISHFEVASFSDGPHPFPP